jgi:hypothetical protein
MSAERSGFVAGSSAERSGFSPSGILGSGSCETFCGEGGAVSIEVSEGCKEMTHLHSDDDDDDDDDNVALLLAMSVHTREMMSMHI